VTSGTSTPPGNSPGRTGKDRLPSLKAARNFITRGILTIVVTGGSLWAGGITAAIPAKAALSAVGPVDPALGFPVSYTDSSGLQLAPCLAQVNPTTGVAEPCVMPTPLPNPTQPPSTPDNIVDEFFYFVADAQAPAGGGTLKYRAALEGAFAGVIDPTGGLANGDQMTFGRLNFVMNGAKANTSFNIVHPYGVDTVTTDGKGGGRFRDEVGCAVDVVTKCNFSVANLSHVGPFLKWDDSLPRVSQPGFLGDPAVDHKVTGSPLGHNYVEVYEGGTVNKTTGTVVGGNLVGRTDVFQMAGKPFVPPATTPPAASASLSPTALSFPNQVVNTTSTAQKVTLTNNGTASLTGIAVSSGSPAFAIVPTGTTCGTTVTSLAAAAPPAAAPSCDVMVAFNPTTTTTPVNSTLTFTDSAGTQTVSLSGTVSAAPVTVPAPPTNLSANAAPAPNNTSQIIVSWTASTGATGYHVYRDGAPITAPTATVTNGISFTDTNLTPGSTHTYRVDAFNTAGTSALTASVSATLQQTTTPPATTLAAPGVPTFTKGTVSATGTVPVNFTWTRPPSGIPANAASLLYTFETSTNGGATWQVQVTVTNNNTAAAGATPVFSASNSRTLNLTAGTSYRARVKVAARDATGATLATSAYATTAAFTP
jgi:hypothetical protein